MTSSQQEMLRKAWLEGRRGNLSALSEAMLWAVRAVWRAEKGSLHGLQTFAAGLVTKVGTGEHPTHRAVGLFYARVDADPEWYPGKSGQVTHGPAKALTSNHLAALPRRITLVFVCVDTVFVVVFIGSSCLSRSSSVSSSSSSCYRLACGCRLSSSFLQFAPPLLGTLLLNSDVPCHLRYIGDPVGIHWGSRGDPVQKRGIRGPCSA